MGGIGGHGDDFRYAGGGTTRATIASIKVISYLLAYYKANWRNTTKSKTYKDTNRNIYH